MGKDKSSKKDRKDKKRKRDKDDEEDYRKAKAEKLVSVCTRHLALIPKGTTAAFACMHSTHCSCSLELWRCTCNSSCGLLQRRSCDFHLFLQAKKVASHLKKHSGGHGYTDQDNPFGDSNVTERFVWGKKLEKQIQSGVDVKDLGAKAEKRRQEERLVSA